MEKPAAPFNEASRLKSLIDLRILDTPAEERFDRITRLAQRALGMPIALISLVDYDRQWFKSVQGLPVRETSREVSFCAHAILFSEPLMVPDAQSDPRFAGNPLVLEAPQIRFYAGQPIHSPEGYPVGTLCVIDSRVRTLDDSGMAALADLGALVENELKLDALDEAERVLRAELTDAERRASVDGLTRLWNRETIAKLLQIEAARSLRTQEGMGVIYVDIDHFKPINDTYGHAVGDQVLAAVAGMMRHALRPHDSLGRYGGDEFLAIVAGATDETALAVGERIRHYVNRHSVLTGAGPIPVTVSVGVCCSVMSEVSTGAALVEAADRALFDAKRAGRDCLALARYPT